MQVKDAKKKINQLTGLSLVPKTEEDQRKQDDLFKMFRSLPKSIPDVEKAISEEKGRLNVTGTIDSQVVKDYEKKTERSCELGKELERVRQKEDDFEEYGIGINVKFRDSEPMRRLTHQHQSGGERSVATMLYMLALQELSEVPFRCVDEINQGMDPINERRVFEMVVNLLSGSADTGERNRSNLGRTQYFMLTPKLLPNLSFSKKMTVLIVHNGSGMLQGNRWNLDEFMERKRTVGYQTDTTFSSS